MFADRTLVVVILADQHHVAFGGTMDTVCGLRSAGFSIIGPPTLAIRDDARLCGQCKDAVVPHLLADLGPLARWLDAWSRRRPIRPRQVRVVPVPFLRKPIGSGSVVAALTGLVGIHPCMKCKSRANRMNKWLVFVPLHYQVPRCVNPEHHHG